MSQGIDAPAGAASVWTDAALACALLATDPTGLGGLVVRAPAGPGRDLLASWLRALFPEGAPFVRVPGHVTDDRLVGGVDLAATLRTGALVTERGVLARADGGVLVLPMAERANASVTSHVCQALDRGELVVAREGVSGTFACRAAVLALDEGVADEGVSAALRDRLAFHVDLGAVDPRFVPASSPDVVSVLAARARLAAVTVDETTLEALSSASLALGIASLRASILTVAAARAHAALAGRDEVEEEDARVAARLVLGPRAVTVPDEEPAPEEPSPPDDDDAKDETEERPIPDAPLADVVIEAAKSGVPRGVLELVALSRAPRGAARSKGEAGQIRASTSGGRPAGVRAGAPLHGERLAIVDTLRAAAPWQPIRRRERDLGGRRVDVRRSDFRVRRYREKMETCVVFCVDASGSAALQRLSEAKGAVEQVLADCYVRRDQVALVAFRGEAAELVLPPTRSLTRARRCLAELAGGGTTPLASGLAAALAVATGAERQGRTPLVVVLTDGRANVARDGARGAEPAAADAAAAARALRAAGVPALLFDCSPRPRPQARELAAEMSARYLPLPHVDSAVVAREVTRCAKDAMEARA